MESKRGFTLVELLVVIAIIGALASIIFVSLSSARVKALDTKRRAEITQVGRLLKTSCYTPAAGPGDYDLHPILDELRIKYPQYASQIPNLKDPTTGSDTVSNYRYVVNGNNCAVYANFQNEDEPVTLPALSGPTPGGGTGVFKASTPGLSGSTKYFQVSN